MPGDEAAVCCDLTCELALRSSLGNHSMTLSLKKKKVLNVYGHAKKKKKYTHLMIWVIVSDGR